MTLECLKVGVNEENDVNVYLKTSAFTFNLLKCIF